MGKKRRSRRSNKRFRSVIVFIVFSFSTLLLVQTRVPHAIRQHFSNNQVKQPIYTSNTSPSTPPNTTPQTPRMWFSLPSSNTSTTSKDSPLTTAQIYSNGQTSSGNESVSANASGDSSLPPSHPQQSSSDSSMQTAVTAPSKKPRSWIQAISSITGTRNHPAKGTIPEGPYPLIPLNVRDTSKHRHHEGAAWAASLNKRGNDTLPLHWLAELLHAQPETPPVKDSSIFSARRKGAWIGCERRTHLICKGAYRGIKKTNAITIVDLACGANSGWLPHVIQKLRSEFRLVSLTCVGPHVSGYDKRVRYITLDPYTELLPNGTDLLLAFKFVEHGNLISAMRFFKNVKRSNVKYLLTENFPDAENRVESGNTGSVLHLNGAMPPFWFPAPEYEYENEEENTEKSVMQITVSKVADMFEEKLTPDMSDLVDPRKRTVRE